MNIPLFRAEQLDVCLYNNKDNFYRVIISDERTTLYNQIDYCRATVCVKFAFVNCHVIIGMWTVCVLKNEPLESECLLVRCQIN
jgi:hypothetical protein